MPKKRAAAPLTVEEPEGANGRPAKKGGRIPPEAVFRFLADRPDLDALRAEYPKLTEDDLKACFAQAGAMVRDAETISFRKGATLREVVRTHGLPAPDESINKRKLFPALLAPFRPGKLLDLGAGRGNNSLAAARLGWQVTAVDVRTTRLPDPEAAKDPEEAALIRSVKWIQADVREFPIERGEYDLICILGLLHHLELADQIALLKRCSDTLTILDTRIAPSNVDRDDVYEGMLVREPGDTPEERDRIPTVSWGNELSFRHTEESLLRLVRNCGYLKMLQMRPPYREDYTFYFCLPHPDAKLVGAPRPPARRRLQD